MLQAMKETVAENPYQAPSLDTVGAPEVPPSFGWDTDGRRVFTARSAQLPMVDPFTGGSSETMMLQRMSIRYLPHWLWTLPVLGAFFGLMADYINADSVGPYALLGALLGWILARLVSIPMPSVIIEFFVEKSTRRRRRFISQILLTLLLATIATALMNRFLPDKIKWLPGMLLLMWLLGSIAVIAFHRRIRCRRKIGDGFVLEGLHPRALQALLENQKTTARHFVS
jgi:hypothetical protein